MRGIPTEAGLAAEIVVAAGAGESGREIARWAGVSASTVSRLLQADRMLKQQTVPKQRAGSLCLDDRVEILVGIKQGESNAAIARRIGFHPGSVGREINNNDGRSGYSVTAAQQRADGLKSRERECWIQTRPWLWEQVITWLRLRWSPQQIAKRLRKDHPNNEHWHVSHESIYAAIYVQAKPELRKELKACLRSGRAKRVPHGHPTRKSHPSIADKINISERSGEADDRAVPGHWEGDLIVGLRSRSYVATLVERSSRFGLLIKLDSKDAVHVAERISQELQKLPSHLRQSLTWDCGTELAQHKAITTTANIDVYFCDPHSPWQRGSNENWNGLVRQFLPKGTDLSAHTQDELNHIAHLLNTRPRETLDWETPAERFNQYIAPTT